MTLSGRQHRSESPALQEPPPRTRVLNVHPAKRRETGMGEFAMIAKSLALAAFMALAATAAYATDQSDPVQYETVISAPAPQTTDIQPIVTASVTDPGKS
jgi:hypothetical protein